MGVSGGGLVLTVLDRSSATRSTVTSGPVVARLLGPDEGGVRSGPGPGVTRRPVAVLGPRHVAAGGVWCCGETVGRVTADRSASHTH